MALIVEIKVVPQSGRNQLLMDKSGVLKCFIKAAPEKGKANKEVVEVVAKILGIPKSSVGLIAGATGRKKLLKINADITYDQLLEKLGSGIQKSIF